MKTGLRNLCALFALVGWTNGGIASTQDICSLTAIQSRTTTALGDAIARFEKIELVKDEFETTAAYNLRVDNARASLPAGPLLIPFPEVLKTEFDADTGVSSVAETALSPHCSPFETIQSDAMKAIQFGERGRRDGRPYCFSYTAGSSDITYYQASNAYGAKFTVEKMYIKMHGLFFGIANSPKELIAGRDVFSKEPIFSFSGSVTEAKSLKTNAQLLVLAEPLSPYTGKAGERMKPTMQEPEDAFFSTSFLVARPLCFAIRDRKTGKIFDAKAANHELFGAM